MLALRPPPQTSEAARYVAHLKARHPLLSSLQRARLAEFALVLRETIAEGGTASQADLARHGFGPVECERLMAPALALIAAVRTGGEAR